MPQVHPFSGQAEGLATTHNSQGAVVGGEEGVSSLHAFLRADDGDKVFLLAFGPFREIAGGFRILIEVSVHVDYPET